MVSGTQRDSVTGRSERTLQGKPWPARLMWLLIIIVWYPALYVLLDHVSGFWLPSLLMAVGPCGILAVLVWSTIDPQSPFVTRWWTIPAFLTAWLAAWAVFSSMSSRIGQNLGTGRVFGTVFPMFLIVLVPNFIAGLLIRRGLARWVDSFDHGWAISRWTLLLGGALLWLATFLWLYWIQRMLATG